MYARGEAVAEVLTALRKAIGKTFSVTPDMLETPPERKLGDVAFPCFELAKGAARNPQEIATELAAKIGPGEWVEEVKAAGPYVNFFFSDSAITARVLADVKAAGAAYGAGTLGEGKKILLEYAQPNTHKAFHVGHVRNAVLGQSIANTLRMNGYKVICASYPGDIGAHVAKALWGFKKFIPEGGKIVPAERTARLQEAYEKATAALEHDPDLKGEIDEVQRALEAGEEPWFSLWKETRGWSLDEFKAIFAELRVEPDVWYFESDVEEEGKTLVKKLLTDAIAKKSEGATIVDLEDEGLGVFLILKSDGSALYATKDLALALRKQREHDPDRQLFVVDTRQSLYFKQLFATLKRMGFTEKLVHIAYDMVNLPEGAMSSRAGNIITYAELRDTLVERLKKETASRHEDWKESKVEKTAKAIALAAITFMMLRQDPNSIITFDMEEALSVDGFTGPYILYTISRIKSIERKTKVKPKVDASRLTHTLEGALIDALAAFPEVVERAGKTFHVSALAQWAFDTAKLFAEYYHEVRVVDAEDREGTAARLALAGSVRQALENALSLLAIEPVEEM